MKRIQQFIQKVTRTVKRPLPRQTTEPPWPHTIFEVTVMDTDRLRPMVIEAREPPSTNEFPRAREKFRIKMAGSDDSRQDASVLIEKMYSWRGYSACDRSESVPNRITLNADFRGSVYGTITVNVDSSIGLVCENAFPDVVQSLRDQGRTLCEFGKLAVDQTVRSKRLLATLFHMVYVYSHRLHGCTDALIEVNPRHVAFYERYLEFQAVGSQRHCERVGAPAVLMRLDFDITERMVAQLGGRWRSLPDEKSFYKYFMPADQEAKVVALLRRGHGEADATTGSPHGRISGGQAQPAGE